MRTINRIIALAVIGMAIAVTAISTVARADMQGGGNSLTIRFCENDEWGEDFSQATDVTVDLVKVATARMHATDAGYDYDFAEAGFPGVDFPATPEDEDWERATESVARLVTADTPKMTVTGTNSVPSLEDGVYLVLVHDRSHPVAYGEDVASSLLVETERWSYSFAPALVALPSRAVTDDGTLGDWQKDVTATMKPTRNAGMGSIRIDKTVEGFDGRATTLVYEIVGEANGEIAYRETRSLSIPAGAAGEAHASVVINDVPTGLTVSVREAYPGAGYELAGMTAPDNPVTARDYQPAFSFRNKPDGTGTSGGGITNRFVYDEDGNRDWTWHAKTAGGE